MRGGHDIYTFSVWVIFVHACVSFGALWSSLVQKRSMYVYGYHGTITRSDTGHTIEHEIHNNIRQRSRLPPRRARTRRRGVRRRGVRLLRCSNGSLPHANLHALAPSGILVLVGHFTALPIALLVLGRHWHLDNNRDAERLVVLEVQIRRALQLALARRRRSRVLRHVRKAVPQQAEDSRRRCWDRAGGRLRARQLGNERVGREGLGVREAESTATGDVPEYGSTLNRNMNRHRRRSSAPSRRRRRRHPT